MLKLNSLVSLHLLKPRPWPFICSLSAFLVTRGSIWLWHYNSTWILWLGLGIGLLGSVLWFLDIKRENYLGEHNFLVSKGLRLGVILFIVSEIMFFFRFFWAYFHSCLGCDCEVGFSWPPYKFSNIIVDPYSIPFLKSILLLSSGVSITWCHHSIYIQKKQASLKSLIITIVLGLYFLYLQIREYKHSLISIKSGTYGRSFFVLTGFHGRHVTIGIILLTKNLFRLLLKKQSKSHHVGLEASIWYWHFVDVVWLMLYLLVYWFGFCTNFNISFYSIWFRIKRR